MDCLSSSFGVINSTTLNNNNNTLRPRLGVCHAKNNTVSTMARVRCAAAASKTYKITILPGDGIGPEIMSVAKNVLRLVGSQQDVNFKFNEMLVGGAAIDATGVPLPDETLAACKQSDAVLLAGISGYKWDNNERHLRPESGLLGLRAGLGVFANLRLGRKQKNEELFRSYREKRHAAMNETFTQQMRRTINDTMVAGCLETFTQQMRRTINERQRNG